MFLCLSMIPPGKNSSSLLLYPRLCLSVVIHLDERAENGVGSDTPRIERAGRKNNALPFAHSFLWALLFLCPSTSVNIVSWGKRWNAFYSSFAWCQIEKKRKEKHIFLPSAANCEVVSVFTRQCCLFGTSDARSSVYLLLTRQYFNMRKWTICSFWTNQIWVHKSFHCNFAKRCAHMHMPFRWWINTPVIIWKGIFAKKKLENRNLQCLLWTQYKQSHKQKVRVFFKGTTASLSERTSTTQFPQRYTNKITLRGETSRIGLNHRDYITHIYESILPPLYMLKRKCRKPCPLPDISVLLLHFLRTAW